jgi:hypothetical protein
MAARRPIKPHSVTRVATVRTADPQTNRAIDALSLAVRKTQAERNRYVFRADIVDGTNKFKHSLGRPCEGYTLSMSIDIGTTRHYIDRTNPRPDLEIWIHLFSEDQLTLTDTTIEVF